MFTYDKAELRLWNMYEMMDRLGLNTGALGRKRPDLSLAIGTCQFCPADEICHDWLARADKSLGKAPAFCPNANIFERARAEQTTA